DDPAEAITSETDRPTPADERDFARFSRLCQRPATEALGEWRLQPELHPQAPPRRQRLKRVPATKHRKGLARPPTEPFFDVQSTSSTSVGDNDKAQRQTSRATLRDPRNHQPKSACARLRV